MIPIWKLFEVFSNSLILPIIDIHQQNHAFIIAVPLFTSSTNTSEGKILIRMDNDFGV